VTPRPDAEVQSALSAAAINTSVSLLDHARLDLPYRGLPDLVRASVHYYNTDDELTALAAHIGALVHSPNTARTP
jgi:cysteine desulfurase/selenocysteine lyase